ncbi:hypothetical protein FGO68_gene14054 [Halteria grandinella]|uniref:Uncharacterized protein n=1 Tax=Halteria grandinella TaxID=5974 RepID=A0A8J8T2P6_HALGN|nr:hypothetical protein FGO68_gene14054 [Halteria grandinella]
MQGLANSTKKDKSSSFYIGSNRIEQTVPHSSAALQFDSEPCEEDMMFEQIQVHIARDFEFSELPERLMVSQELLVSEGDLSTVRDNKQQSKNQRESRLQSKRLYQRCRGIQIPLAQFQERELLDCEDIKSIEVSIRSNGYPNKLQAKVEPVNCIAECWQSENQPIIPPLNNFKSPNECARSHLFEKESENNVHSNQARGSWSPSCNCFNIHEKSGKQLIFDEENFARSPKEVSALHIKRLNFNQVPLNRFCDESHDVSSRTKSGFNDLERQPESSVKPAADRQISDYQPNRFYNDKAIIEETVNGEADHPQLMLFNTSYLFTKVDEILQEEENLRSYQRKLLQSQTHPNTPKENIYEHCFPRSFGDYCGQSYYVAEDIIPDEGCVMVIETAHCRQVHLTQDPSPACRFLK